MRRQGILFVAYANYLPAVDREKSVIENVIGYVLTLLDRFCFIEPPMDTQVNAALTILFLSL
jgi:hypothetical protein